MHVSRIARISPVAATLVLIGKGKHDDETQYPSAGASFNFWRTANHDTKNDEISESGCGMHRAGERFAWDQQVQQRSLSARTAHPKQEISADASAAIAQMEKSLRSGTVLVPDIRMPTGLSRSERAAAAHRRHAMKVVVHIGPDRMAVDVTKATTDQPNWYTMGKSLTMLGVETNKYATIPCPTRSRECWMWYRNKTRLTFR